jgi:hypothetical protein
MFAGAYVHSYELKEGETPGDDPDAAKPANAADRGGG